MSQAGPTGSVIDVPGRFTHCVGREDYHNVPPFLKAGPAGLGKAACDYILGGKLVCLADSDECAFGHIISIEPVGSGKSGFDQIDNDFCFNVLLSPWVVSDFSASLSRDANLIRVATDGMQGRLLVDPKKDTNPLPQPDSPAASSPALEAALGKNMTGIAITYLFGDGQPHPYDPNPDATERLLEEVKQDAAGIKRIDLPVLHAECEGSRIFMVCSALGPILDILDGKIPGTPGPSANEICHDVIGWIPFLGDLICTIIEIVVDIALLPLLLAGLIQAGTAWVAAQLFDDAFITGPVSTQIAIGDPVIVTGRWAWDGGHSGWNEFHPVKTVQKIVLPPELDGNRATAGPSAETRKQLADFRDRWCRLVAEAPPAHWPGPHPQDLNPAQLASLTPTQRATYDLQHLPQNKWSAHPLIDGCAPDEPPPPIIK